MNFSQKKISQERPSVTCRGRELQFERVRIMGVLNVTPNSFSDGGKFLETNFALEHIDKMTMEGADIIDIGGESTHPDSIPVSDVEEIKRIAPILERLDFDRGPLISIDTRKPSVVKEVIKAGVHIINDVNGFTDEQMIGSVHKTGVALLVMCPGKIKSFYALDEFEHIQDMVYSFFKFKTEELKSKGFKSLIIDPGIGFNKSLRENLELVKKIYRFKDFNVPITIGISRKGFVGTITQVELPHERLIGSVIAEAFGVVNGANIIRTHDVKHSLQGVRMAESLKGNFEKDSN
ncbi:MAG: dihydropteroate synthase [Nitrospinota bacterium]|nr:dihydropteroate synthase [Nitrospinota bacterium]